MIASKCNLRTFMSRAMISGGRISAAKSAASSVHKIAISSAVVSVRYSSSLNKVVAKELKDEMAAMEEGEENDELAEAKAKFLKIFKINDQPGFGIVKLEGKFKSEIIEVVFDCQDTAEIDPKFEEMEEGEEFPEEDVEGSTGVRFHVTTYTKEGGDKILINCLAGERLEIENVQYVPAGKNVLDQDLYGGPVFSELDEHLRTSFYEYLQERGIDDDFSFFVLSYANDKENREYVTWLKKIKDFTA